MTQNRGVEPAQPLSYWLAASPRPAAVRAPSLRGEDVADVAIVGAGYTGLWAAIRLLETDPGLRIRVLEMEHVGFGASGRNGGFCAASLTHGLENGLRHFPDEIDVLVREGQANLRELVAFVRRHDIDCDLEETGVLGLTDRPDDVDEFRAHAELANRHGERTIFLDGAAARAEVHSPRWTAGLWQPDDTVMLDPVMLVRGLARVAVEMGAVLHEETRVTKVERVAGGVRLATVAADGTPGSVRASHAVVATSAYSGWLRRLLPLFVPVYDYALVSEPLTPEQRTAVGWARRQGLSDAYNQFHYFRLTADDRILWGGGDAIYHPGNGVGPAFDRRPATFERLEADFRATFPQLADLRFPFRWGGAIDTTTRFTVTFGRTIGDRVVYAIGYTGLGVGAARWAAGIVRDMLLRPDSDLLRLRFVRTRPFPFPPEPLRNLVVQAVHDELARADAGGGRRGPLLRTLDTLGIGFDS